MPYSGHDELLSCCVSFAAQGRERGARLIFLLAAAKLDDLRDSLDPAAADIAFVPTDEHGRNPARMTTLLESFQATAEGAPCMGVQELVSASRTPAARQEAHLAESMLNLARLQSWPMSVICAYDADELDRESLATMRRSHPTVHGQGANPAYEPDLTDELFQAPLSEPPSRAVGRRFAGGDLAAARDAVRNFAGDCGLSADRREDLVLAANEVVTNSIRHGGGECRLAVWDDGDTVVCDARDTGVITDPLVGRLTPPLAASAGRGLWLANQLCDLVQIRSSQRGTVVRLHVEHAR